MLTMPLMFASAQPGEVGVMPIVITEGQLEVVPISTVAARIGGGASPILYSDLVSLIRQMSDENQRLKAENERLWVIAGKPAPSSTPVVVVQAPAPQPPPSDNGYAARQQMRMTLLQSLIRQNQSNTVNVNVRNCSAYPAPCAGR